MNLSISTLKGIGWKSKLLQNMLKITHEVFEKLTCSEHLDSQKCVHN